MWNRVVLLTAGVAFGWSLVTRLSGPEDRSARARANMGLAALVGLALVIWLGVERPAAGWAGAFVFGVGALATYAMRAKQILRIPETKATPVLAPEAQGTPLAVLIAPGPPPTYDPASLARLQAAGHLPQQLGRHWFAAPAAYRQVRLAYRRHGSLPLWAALETARRQLQQALGDRWSVELIFFYGEPPPETQIRKWLEDGSSPMVILPIDLGGQAIAEIRSLARLVEAEGRGSVQVAPSTRLVPDAIYQNSLQALISDAMPPACPDPDPAAVTALASHVRSRGPELPLS